VHYPLFTGLKAADLKKRSVEIQEMVRLGLSVLDLVERSGKEMDSSTVSEIRLDLDDGLSLQTSDNRTIVLGKDNFEKKFQRYARLKRFLTRRGEWPNARIINLDFEDRALVRWDKPPVEGQG
jgi:cell division septal protein FtsQ